MFRSLRGAAASAVAVLVVACMPTRDGGLGLPDEPVADDDVADDDDGDDGVPDEWGEDGDGATFFPLDRLLRIDIELPDESWDALVDEPYGWTPGRVEIDGRRINDVAIRLRGRIGSFREVWEKPKWRLDFNRLVPGRRIEGLEALSLDNNVVDCSGLKQTLGFYVLGLLDVPASRGGFASVTVNGEDYGVYNTVEVQDDRFLKSRWADGTGNLYDGAYTWFGDWNVRFADFTSGNGSWFELEEGVDVGATDVDAVTAALEEAESGDFTATMDAVWDLAAFHRYAAAEYWIGQNDGYILNRNNNRVYFDPADGRGSFISYDLDYAFLWEPWEASWDRPAGRLAAGCFADEECSAGVRATAADVLDTLEGADLLGTFEAWDDVTLDAVLDDGNDECGASRVRSGRDGLRQWIDLRGDAMRDQWELP